MHDAHFKVSLQAAQTHSRLALLVPPRSHSPHTRSPHSHALQELKDELPDDTAWPVVMQWFNEDHWGPLNRSSFKNTSALRQLANFDLSDH